MFNDDEIELTSEERAAFDALPRERAPSDLLEERVVRQLRTDGMFGTSRTESPRRSRIAFFALRAAAAVMLFIAGAMTERFLTSPGDNNSDAPMPTRAVQQQQQQQQLPAQRSEPSRLAQLELWI